MEPNQPAEAPKILISPKSDLGLSFMGSVIATAELSLPLAMSPHAAQRYLAAAIAVAIVLGILILIGSAWNLVFEKPWRPPAFRTLSCVLCASIAVVIFVSWPDGRWPLRAAILEGRTVTSRSPVDPVPNKDGMIPYFGPELPTSPCPEGQLLKYEHCIEKPERFVKRNIFGSCPKGYVDHPRTPELCALPAMARQLN